MNINNLEENTTIKNYKELCRILEIKPTTGKAKINQLEELNIYCKYERQGNKYIIKEVYKNPTITIDDILKSRNSKYIKPLANIILKYLHDNSDDLKEIPLNKLFTVLGITNTNYTDCNYYRKELSQIYNIHLASIYYFYSNTKTQFKNIIERCLNNLQKRRVLNWYKVVMVKEENEIYKADKETEKFIIDTEKQALQYLNCNNMYELIKDKKKLKEFNKIVTAETGIEYFYAYDLVIGEKAIKIEIDNINKELEEINKLMIDKSEKLFDKEKYILYKDDYKQLNNLLIDLSNQNNELLQELKNKRNENIKNYNNDIYINNKIYNENIKEITYKYKDEYIE